MAGIDSAQIAAWERPAPAGADAGPLLVSEITTFEELRKLDRVWDAILTNSETATPFLTHEWVLSWWEAFAHGQDLWVLVLHDEQGVAGIAPFARARRACGPLRYRAIEFIGTGPLRFLGMGLSDRSDLLLARRHVECVLKVLERLAATRSDWEVVDLRFIPEQSTTLKVLKQEAEASGLGLSFGLPEYSPYLPLTGTYEEYVRGRTANFRSGLKRKLKRLEAAKAEFTLDAGECDPVGALAAATEVSLESWKTEEGSALLLHRNVQGFLSLLLPRLQARGRLYVSVLSLDGEAIAHELGFRLGKRMWFYDHAYKTRHAELSPGYALTAKIIERAWSEGLVEYDFLRGNENYKRGWQTQVRKEIQVVLDNRAAKSVLVRAFAFQLKWRLKETPRLVKLQGRAAGLLNRMLQRP